MACSESESLVETPVNEDARAMKHLPRLNTGCGNSTSEVDVAGSREVD